MTSSTTSRSAKLHAPELSAEHLAEIEEALASTHSDWQPSGLPTGITYTDIFCGFGGSSIGLENAGMTLALGANHWPKAIETHALNFPNADHLIADVSNYDMRRLPDTDVLWASPICTELSPRAAPAAPAPSCRCLSRKATYPRPRWTAHAQRSGMWCAPPRYTAIELS